MKMMMDMMMRQDVARCEERREAAEREREKAKREERRTALAAEEEAKRFELEAATRA